MKRLLTQQSLFRTSRFSITKHNNQTMLFIQASDRQALYYDAMRQNYTVFQAGRLKLIAAPWAYAFVSDAKKQLMEAIKSRDSLMIHYFEEDEPARYICDQCNAGFDKSVHLKEEAKQH